MGGLPKPDRFASISGWLVDDHYLPAELLAELRFLLPKALRDHRGEAFLAECAHAAQAVNEHKIVASGADQLKQLNNVASEARALLTRLNELQADAIELFNATFDDSTTFGDPVATLSNLSRAVVRADADGRFLGTAWDIVSDLAAVAECTVAQCRASGAATKPSELNARHLVWLILGSHKQIFGKLPSLGKTAWFPTFVQHLGQWQGLKLSCGVTLVEGVVKNRFRVNPD